MMKNPLHLFIAKLDRLLRQRCGIFEFSSDERCLLRISLDRSDRTVLLQDGTRIAKGDCFGDLHWWNEHMPGSAVDGSGLRMANAFKRNLLISFRQLAQEVRSAPEYGKVKAFRGVNSFGGRNGLVDLSHVAGHWGFELIMDRRAKDFRSRFVDYWERVYLLALIRTYSKSSGDRRLRGLKRGEVWISKTSLIARYGLSDSSVD